MKALSPRVIYALAATPLLWAGWFYLYVLRQRVHLGFWPLPSQPDPKDAGYVFHHLSIYLGVLIAPVLAIAAVGLGVHRRGMDRHFRWWFVTALAAFSVGCYLGVILVDPGDYWVWFRD